MFVFVLVAVAAGVCARVLGAGYFGGGGGEPAGRLSAVLYHASARHWGRWPMAQVVVCGRVCVCATSCMFLPLTVQKDAPAKIQCAKCANKNSSTGLQELLGSAPQSRTSEVKNYLTLLSNVQGHFAEHNIAIRSS